MEKNWRFTRLKAMALLSTLCVKLILCLSLNEEGLALLRVKERIVSDPFGALSNWEEIDGEVNPCSWFGVECSDGKVVVLNLDNLCLRGTLAPELRNLIHIKSINLRNNSFSGNIPDGIGTLKELEVLDLGYNNFSGSLPSDVGSNPSLAILLLDNNGLFDNLSPEISNLQMLSEVQVDENQLSYATEKSSCNGRSVTWTVTQTENAGHGRQLQVTAPFPQDSNGRLAGRFFNPFTPIKKRNTSFSLPPSPPSSMDDPPSLSPGLNAPPPSTTPIMPNRTSSNTNSSTSPPPVSAMTPSAARDNKISSLKHHQVAILAGSIGGALILLASIMGMVLYRSNKVVIVKPWVTGLSGQLQKVFVTGVPKLKRAELEIASEDFSNVIVSSPIGTLYKGTLSSGVEIAIASVAMTSAKDWSKNLEMQFRHKIDTLSRVNHKNFVNLLGYCEEEEPFTRMMVFEYAPNGTLFEHLHIKESEHLDWGMRIRIAMGMAYCLQHMHQLNPPIAHNNLNSSSVYLTEDNAAKISDISFWNAIAAAEREAAGKKLLDTPIADQESNVYGFGVLLFEMLTGRLPYLVDNGSLVDWASHYLIRGERPLKEMLDPTLDSYQEEQLEQINELIRSCVHPDPQQRPAMQEVTGRLREITGITPDGAIPKLSPLWWAELEILSTDAM
ncbi:hypothetical protein HS088_TW14G00692 [Tripterygium wilfordii]|uniref:Protein kinase domain-containing protein n=1 Tax=Tripterygium wilfordii TaxID=458696 RepID=A0A7J7CRB7_TRIWF|nr:probable inactive receptor-like protein kinase At3g56050 [Tripterygium wilfordii]KAF5736548.1 hypothetical protein HS088_TW14G00692 [Tripterygium wilfordii]